MTRKYSGLILDLCLGYFSTEPEGLVEEELAVTPEPEPEAEPDPDVVDGKPALEPETQQQQHTTEEQGEKCPVSSPLPSDTADPAPAPAAEDNRVGLNPHFGNGQVSMWVPAD